MGTSKFRQEASKHLNKQPKPKYQKKKQGSPTSNKGVKGKGFATRLRPADKEHRRPQPYDLYCVLDFECTCEAADPSWPNEIIEFPVCVYDPVKDKIIAEFHSFVRPLVRPVLTSFCTNFTGIQQEQVDSAPTLPQVLADFDAFLRKTIPNDSTFVFATDTTSDIFVFLFRQAVGRDRVAVPDYFKQFVDIRATFHHFFKPRYRLKLGAMIREMGMKFEGREHCGLDDTRNITRLMSAMIDRGCVFGYVEKVRGDYGMSGGSPVTVQRKFEETEVEEEEENEESDEEGEEESSSSGDDAAAAPGDSAEAAAANGETLNDDEKAKKKKTKAKTSSKSKEKEPVKDFGTDPNSPMHFSLHGTRLRTKQTTTDAFNPNLEEETSAETLQSPQQQSQTLQQRLPREPQKKRQYIGLVVDEELTEAERRYRASLPPHAALMPPGDVAKMREKRNVTDNSKSMELLYPLRKKEGFNVATKSKSFIHLLLVLGSRLDTFTLGFVAAALLMFFVALWSLLITGPSE